MADPPSLGQCSQDQFDLMVSGGLFTEAQASYICSNFATQTALGTVSTSLWGTTEGLNCLYSVLCAALVFIMHGGFAMLCAGAIRSKNTMNILLQTILDACVSAIAFYVVGFGIAYGGYAPFLPASLTQFSVPPNPFVGTSLFALSKFPSQNTNNQISPDGTMISVHWQDWIFQWAFAATATTIPAGAVAERFNFNAYLGYSFFLSAWVYPIVVHWAWSQYGWLGYGRWQLNHLFRAGYIDFAGSGVVHMVGGFTGMWACILVGPRMGRFDSNGKPVDMPGHSATLVVLGTVLLWFGWYGFNPGSMIFINSANYAMVVGRAAVTTTLAGAAGGLMALAVAFMRNKAWDLLACCNGVLCGFVAVTGGCHVLEPWAAIICGAVASVVFEFVCVMFLRLKIDDPLSAAPMHGFCGAWGLFWVGLMAKQEYILQVYGGSHTGTEANAPVPNADDVLNYPYGLFYYGGGGLLLASQIIGILVIFAWVTVNMVPFFYIFKSFGALRISAEEEQAGLDASKHGGSAYNYDGGLNKPEKASRLYGGPSPGTVGATFSSAPEHGI